MSVFVSFISASCTSSGGQQTVNIRSGGNGADETFVAYSLSGPAGSYSGGDYYSESGTTGPINHTFDLVDLPDGDFTLTASNNLGQEKTATFTVACGTSSGGGGGTPPPPPPPPPSKVYGCTDPEADNYDPAATDDNGSCTYTPRLVAAALPELAPLGVPLVASLAAAPIAGNVPAPASVLINLTLLVSVGMQVRVDGYRFTCGPLIVPGRFLNGQTLASALLATPVLAAAYVISQPAPNRVLLTARVPGLPGTPTVSTSDPGGIVLTATPGVARFYSQKRYQWGCYVEIWAGCGALFGGAVDKTTAVLAQRVQLAYRADNAYQVDLAQALRTFTGHAYPQPDGRCPDRLVSYFLRFGEEYSDTPSGLRRVRTTYETAVVWGLEAMVVPAPVAGVYLLSSRPSPWRVVAGRRAVAALLTKQADPLALVLRYRLATSRATQDETLSVAADPQQVISYTPAWLFPDGTLSGELRPSDDNGTVGAALATMQAQADGVGLTFVNREGACDTVFFTGSNEETTKPTAASYTNTAGPVNLSTEVALPSKLYSGLLDFATWHWLRQQLGVSPAVWLETTAGPVRMFRGDVATEADTQKGEYSLSVELSPPPVRGLSN